MTDPVQEAAIQTILKLQAENSTLRTIVSKAAIPCVYCGLDDMSRCASGFPGCARADDMLCGEDEAFKRLIDEKRELENKLRAANAEVRIELKNLRRYQKARQIVAFLHRRARHHARFAEEHAKAGRDVQADIATSRYFDTRNLAELASRILYGIDLDHPMRESEARGGLEPPTSGL